jgi:hypothetical protein
MDKLEHYLDQVCRRIGGPWSLRQHVRQELREHLLDAVAQHKAAGLSEAEALERALEEFGKAEEVRSDLEATHGQRLMAVVIDKALQWKEMTMKAKWLWMTWAHLGLAVVIVLEVLFIAFNVVFIVPRFQKLMHDGIIDPAMVEEAGASWMPAFLNGLNYVGGHYTTFLLLGAAVACGLFEWRVKSEHKPFIRLAALGTAAVGLMVVIMLMAGSLVVSFCLGVPATGRIVRPFALQQVATIDTSVSALEQALAKKDWEAMQENAERASQALGYLAKAGPAVPALARWNEPPSAEELRAHVQAASQSLAEVQQAVRDKEIGRLKTALQKLHQAFAPVREAAKRPAR